VKPTKKKSVIWLRLAGCCVMERAEEIRWWDSIDALAGAWSGEDFEGAMRMVRACRHPDVQWLASLLPVGELSDEGSKSRLCALMLEQRGDARAMHLAWSLDIFGLPRTLLERSAAMGYAPAQASMCSVSASVAPFPWAQASAAQGHKRGQFHLANCLLHGDGCAKDTAKAIELFRAAAEAGLPAAQHPYGDTAFAECDWQRFYWWGLAAETGCNVSKFCEMLFSFFRCERREMGRVVHTVAPLIRRHYLIRTGRFLWRLFENKEEEAVLLRVTALHHAMLGRARRAMLCWSVVGSRCGLVKDVRVVIAKMAWEEAWRWSDDKQDAAGEDAKQ
jgi:hypothetical protein